MVSDHDAGSRLYVNDTVILDIGSSADNDRLAVGADDGVKPDTGFVSYGHISANDGSFCDIHIFSDSWVFIFFLFSVSAAVSGETGEGGRMRFSISKNRDIRFKIS